MPAKLPKKKKKSFLQKVSCAFAKKKRKERTNSGCSSSTSGSSSSSSSSDETSTASRERDRTSNSAGTRSRSQTPVAPPRKVKTDGARFNAAGQREKSVVPRITKCPESNAAVQEENDVSRIIDSPANPHDCSTVGQPPPANLEIPSSRDEAETTCSALVHKNYAAKKSFMQGASPCMERNVGKNNASFAAPEDAEICEAINCTIGQSNIESTKKFVRKIVKGENRDTTDSDSEDGTDYETDFFDDEANDFLEAERDELDYGELYFTTGKYISYFFLQMERQSYNPRDVYTIVRYRKDEQPIATGKKGENSSSGSTSPNIPTSLRRRLLHRRSADNLAANSPTNSMRHSSPESIRSAPIPLKPRSTSHDALSKKNKSQVAGQTDSASMDSLAKRALLAAQVLNLIPTQKARERNFLHGRIAANSLLGPVELEKVLPNREIRIFVGTWNMNGQTPPKELNDFMLPSDIQTVPDILAIGTQESCSERSEWEAALQETLGPSHVLLTSTGLGTLHLALFLRRDLIWFCSVPEDDNFSTRPGTAFRTKGAVALALMLFGTSFLFVTAHLTAHQDKVKERVNDIKKIVRNLELPKDLPTRHKSKDVTQNFDCVFWCGDLNFRLSQPREEVIQWISDTSFPRESPINLHKDQLRTTLNEGAVLRGFEEAPITFPPTYKYDPGTQNFDTSSKQRTPAYTDRILFKGKTHSRGYIRRVSHESTNSHRDGNIECLIYDSVPSICTSDHKPVWGVFKTTVRPGIDTIPLAAGLFNREVYLEGIRRRAAAMDDSHNSTRACSIQ